MTLQSRRPVGRLENLYWSSRQWIYDIPTPRTCAPRIASSNAYAADRSGRALTADDRQPVAADSAADSKVREVLAQSQLHSIKASMRPMTVKLLERMWQADGHPVPLGEICRHLWGRPAAPTYSTFHTTICKANAALRLANCPLRLRSRLNQVIFSVS